jgi:hypothetical protein
MTMGYKIQIDDIVRDATDDEAAALEATQAEAAAQAAAQAAKAAARQAVLDKLGLTADEATALLG